MFVSVKSSVCFCKQDMAHQQNHLWLQAKALQLSKICLKLDNQVLINTLTSKQYPIELYKINLDIENIFFLFYLSQFLLCVEMFEQCSGHFS